MIWLALAAFGGLVGLDATSFAQTMISRPLIAATITGREIMVCANDVASNPTSPPNAASASQVI